jgi:ribosomal protein S18 acetylase RimI-like enzyme
VLPDFAGQGIGSALLDAVYKQLAHQSSYSPWLGVLAGNERAIAFYERHGLSRFSVQMRRRVEDRFATQAHIREKHS